MIVMGCGGSKVDDLPLVIRCRERKELIKAAVDHRYSLAASHVTYFRSLKDVGDALCRFVDEELVIGGLNPPPSSPVLTLPSDEGKKKKNKNNNKSSSSATSLTHSASHSHHHSSENNSGSHLHFDDTGSDSISSDHLHDSPDKPEPEREPEPEPYYYSSQPEMNSYSYSYYMKRSSTEIPSMVYEEPPPHSSNFYPGYPQYGGGMMGGGGYFGVPMGSDSSPPQNHPYYEPFRDPYYYNQPQPQVNPPDSPPSPPPAPEVSPWDFLNPFDSIENVYPAYYPRTRYGVGSTSTSSPDSVEVRRREGIPDLEDETKQEQPTKVSHKEKQKLDEKIFRAVPDSGEGTSRAVPSQNEETKNSVEEKEIQSSPEIVIVSESSTGEDEISRKKGVSFEVDVQSVAQDDGGSSKPSSLTTLSTHVTRDIEEVVNEIRDEFEAASGYGKEVAVMLEVGKLPYQSTGTVLKGISTVISSRILNLVAPSMLTHSHHQSRRSRPAAASIMKMAKAKYGESEVFRMKSGKLSLTLERLYAWEKKLYKEVKDEERLRVVYEKKCKRLKILDNRGAESNKIEATQASIRKLLTKINITIRAIDAISSRIHKLRNEELQPQITELIHGLIRMWKNMLKCHQKQFQAIIESKSCTLMARTGAGRDSSLRATVELQVELLNWSSHFSDWINTQKSYIESLNGWLLRCLLEEPEETPDGVMPFSPGRIGAPPIFVICNDWYQAMDRLRESEVANTMNAFALSLHQLWERQDEEQRQRLKAEYLSKDFEKRLRTLQKKEIKTRNDLDALSDKSVVATESGVSPLDDLKVDLDSMRKRLEDEKARYKETVKQVHKAASTSLQSGLIPIFETLGNFTSETLKAYEHVRIQNAGEPT